MMAEADPDLIAAVFKERPRLRNFIRRRVSDPADADDILQDVLYEFVQSYRLPEPVERASAWLFRVARNRIVDFFRKQRRRGSERLISHADEGEIGLDLAIPAADGPESAYERALFLASLQVALDELPAEQRSVFLAHEIEGVSFNEMSAQTGIAVNTLLARKRYAVLQLRRRLQPILDPFAT